MSHFIATIQTYIINQFGFETGNLIKNFFILFAGFFIGAVTITLVLCKIYLTYKKLNPVKKPLPLDPDLAGIRLEYKGHTRYIDDSTNVFELLESLASFLLFRLFPGSNLRFRDNWKAKLFVYGLLILAFLITLIGILLALSITYC